MSKLNRKQIGNNINDIRAVFLKTGVMISITMFITPLKTKRLEKLSGDVEDNIIVWGLNEISRHAVNAGLVSWLINKASVRRLAFYSIV